ncbi:hypothetical protein BDR05DRAFT_953723 [Suillus weaverae]|nr:hypothetical protein BDR05DRAFT_953723 [Suillus weaverae]
MFPHGMMQLPSKITGSASVILHPMFLFRPVYAIPANIHFPLMRVIVLLLGTADRQYMPYLWCRDLRLQYTRDNTTRLCSPQQTSSLLSSHEPSTAPPPSQFTKVDPRAMPAPARIETVLDPADIRVFGPQPADSKGIFAIPYGHPSIFTSTFLNMAACIIYKPLELLICIICEIGIATKCLSSHRQKHHDVPALTAEQISALAAYKLHESDSFEDWDNASPVVPGIPYQEGYMCTFQGCCFATISEQRIRAHDRGHPTRNNWKNCIVQALYASVQRKYPVVVPHSPALLAISLFGDFGCFTSVSSPHRYQNASDGRAARCCAQESSSVSLGMLRAHVIKDYIPFS